MTLRLFIDVLNIPLEISIYSLNGCNRHIRHAGCCLMFLITYEEREQLEPDDRPTTPQE